MKLRKKDLPAGLLRLYAATYMMLFSTVGMGAPFFAGKSLTTDECCKYKIFRDADEFRSQRGECIGAEDIPGLSGLLSGSFLKVSTSPGVTKISLDSLWGFQQDDRSYRVLGKRLYRILDYGPAVIYRGVGKFQLRYYFSSGLEDDIYWFSKKNLRRAFSVNQIFIKHLDDALSARQLLRYDPCTRKFLIQHLLATDQNLVGDQVLSKVPFL